MIHVNSVFSDAFNHTVNQIIESKQKEDIASFLLELNSTVSIYMIFTPSGITDTVSMVFQKTNIRDFIFKLSTNFQIRLGVPSFSQEYRELIKVIADSVCHLPSDISSEERINGSEYMAIPNEIYVRLPSIDDIENLLLKNRWMVILVLLSSLIPSTESIII